MGFTRATVFERLVRVVALRHHHAGSGGTVSNASDRPAGWYPDPENHDRERYWDGAQWTEDTPVPVQRSGTISAPRPRAEVVTHGPRNGLGPTALLLGIVGVLFGLFPATFFVAAPLGVTGFLLGRAGHRRCMLGSATNGRVAMAGSVISGAAVVLACIGAVIVFTDAID